MLKRDLIIIPGDFDAQLGGAWCWIERTTGPFRTSDHLNNNCNQLVSFFVKNHPLYLKPKCTTNVSVDVQTRILPQWNCPYLQQLEMDNISSRCSSILGSRHSLSSLFNHCNVKHRLKHQRKRLAMCHMPSKAQRSTIDNGFVLELQNRFKPLQKELEWDQNNYCICY